MVYENIALRLQLPPQKLERESLRLFLNHRLRLVESQLLNLARKYGVETVAELDQLVQSGQIHEREAFEDYFEFDRLEAERDTLLDALEERREILAAASAEVVEHADALAAAHKFGDDVGADEAGPAGDQVVSHGWGMFVVQR